MDEDRNLLFGLLAIQLKGLTPEQFMEAAAAWTTNPAISLAQRLVDQGLLTESDRELLERLRDEAIRAHEGDIAATLQTLGVDAHERESLLSTVPLDATKTAPMTGATFLSRAGKLISGVEEAPGRYSLISQHARGGMGRVLLVHDEFVGRNVALKELLPFGAPAAEGEKPTPVRHTASLAARFLQEARITGQLEHPAIVPVYELGRRPDNTLYYTMKLVKGKTLGQALKDSSTLDARLELLPNFVDLCQAIAYAHDRGVIHRDIKPSNVMIGAFGETVVLDWGLAKLRDAEDVNREEIEYTLHYLDLDDQEELTKTAYGRALGTPYYMPPEQAEGRLDDVNERSDVYSLGAVLYEMLTGATPYTGKSTREIVNKVITTRPAPVLEANPDAPPELAVICEKALQHDPANRYESAVELAEEVRRFITGSVVRAYRYSLWETLSRYYRKHRATVHTAVVAVALLAAVGAYSYVSILHARDREREQRLVAEDAQRNEATARSHAERSGYITQLALLHEYIGRQDFAMANRTADSALVGQRNWEWGFLLNQANPDLLTVQADHPIHGVTLSPDATLVATSGSDSSVQIWDLATGSLKTTCESDSISLAAPAVFSPDGARLAGAGQDELVWVWEVSSGKRVHTLSGHTKPVLCADFSPDGTRIVSAAHDGTVRLWDAASGAQVAVLQVDGAQPTRPTFRADGKSLAVSYEDGTVRVWNLDSLQEKYQCPTEEHAVFSPDGRFLATAANNEVLVWDAETGGNLHRFEARGQAARLRFGSKSDTLLAASRDGTVRLWVLNSGNLLGQFSLGSALFDAAFGRGEAFVIACSQTNKYAVWDVHTGALVNDMGGQGGVPWCVDFSHDGTRMVTATTATSFQVWDPLYRVGRTLLDYTLGPNYPAVAVSEKGAQVATLDTKGLHLFPANGQGERVLFAPNRVSAPGAQNIEFSSDGTRLVAPLDAYVPLVWNLAQQDFVQLVGHQGHVMTAAFDAAGQRVVTASRDMTARIWDAQTGDTLHVLGGDTDMLWDAQFSPNGRLVLTANNDGTAGLWDTESGKRLFTLKGHTGPILAGTFSTDGIRAVTASADATVREWDTSSGKELRVVHGHGAGILDLSLSGDGRFLATSSFDGTSRLWDTAGMESLVILSGVVRARYMSSASALITVSGDGRTERWEAAPSSSTQESFARYRTENYSKAQSQLVPSIVPSRILMVASDIALAHSLRQIIDVLKNEEASPTSEPFTGGLTLSKGPRLLTFSQFGFDENDTIVEVSGKPLTQRADAVAVLQEVLVRVEGSPVSTTDLLLLRGDRRIPAHLYTRACQQQSLDITLTSDEAAELTKMLAHGLGLYENERAAIETTPLAWGAGMGMVGEPSTLLTKAGLSDRDRLLGINDSAMSDLDSARNTLQELGVSLAQKTVPTLTLDIQRGSFIRLHVKYTVQR